MKLHEDERYDENGLILDAARFAAHRHKGQTRKYGHSDRPYITHPIRVAGMIAIHPDTSVEMVAAAYLHDLLEDTTTTVEDLVVRFGPEVAKLVGELTNTSKETGAPRVDRKRMDRARIYGISKEAKLIKLVDRIDNLTEMYDDSQTPYDFFVKYRKESLELLEESLTDVDHDLEVEVRRLAE